MIAAVLAGVLTLQAAPEPPTAIGIRAVAFPGLSAPKTVGCLSLRAGLTLTSDHEGFGGYSDLALGGTDGRATLVSDAGHVLRLRFDTNPAGDVIGVSEAQTTRIIERDGSLLSKRDGDAEGVAWLGQGYAVAFEGEHRIAKMTAGGALGKTLYPPEQDTSVFGGNSGFEALASLGEGRLIALSEGKDAKGGAVVRQGLIDVPFEQWTRHTYRPVPAFSVTGAAVDPATGDLFVLERAYSPWRGARMRVVRVPSEDIGEAVIEGAELTRMGFLEGIDNMEGIIASRTSEGALRLYLVSDDNFSAAQRTVLLTLGLAPGCEDGDTAQSPARRDPAPQEAVDDQEPG